MGLTRRIIGYGLIAVAGIGLQGCWDFRDDTLEISRKSEIAKLDLDARFITRADMDNDGDEDCVVAGNLPEEHGKTAVYLLENKKTRFEARLLHDEIPVSAPRLTLYDTNGDGLKDIIVRGMLKGNYKRFDLINKGDWFVLD